MTTVLAFIFVFGILVFVHELGHYLAARVFKVRVDEFAFGFPPRIWAKRVKETEYAINAIPIGGYVKLLGEVGEDTKGLTKEELKQIKKDAKNPANLQNKKPWQRAVILGAGVTMNLLLAWILLTVFYIFGGTPLLPNMYKSKLVENNQKIYVTEVTKDTPAEKAGINVGDQVVSIDGVKMYDSTAVFAAIQMSASSGTPKNLNITLLRNGNTVEKTVATYKEPVTDSSLTSEVVRIGIFMEQKGDIKTKWWLAPFVAAEQTWELVKLNAIGLYDFFYLALTQFKISKNVGGPIAIAQISGEAAKLGFAPLIQVVAVLSTALALLNIMPFPALDGGHILFLGIEKLIRRPVPVKIKNTINYAGFGLLLLIMAAVTAGDLSRIGVFSFVKGLF